MSHPAPETRARDPFRSSVMAWPALLRLLVVLAGLVPLWLAIGWALAVP